VQEEADRAQEEGDKAADSNDEPEVATVPDFVAKTNKIN
jgi:hypothetical protein